MRYKVRLREKCTDDNSFDLKLYMHDMFFDIHSNRRTDCNEAKAQALTKVRTAIARITSAVSALSAALEQQVEAMFASEAKQVKQHKEQLETLMECARSMLDSYDRLVTEHEHGQGWAQSALSWTGGVGQVRRDKY